MAFQSLEGIESTDSDGGGGINSGNCRKERIVPWRFVATNASTTATNTATEYVRFRCSVYIAANSNLHKDHGDGSSACRIGRRFQHFG